MIDAHQSLIAAARLLGRAAFGLAITVALSGCGLMSAFEMAYVPDGRPYRHDRRAPERQSWSGEQDRSRPYAIGARRDVRELEAEGWLLLEQGRMYTAHQVFDEVAARQPHDARPRIGMALALSLQGHHPRAERLMREAMEIDPSAFGSLDMGPELGAHVDGLIATYVDVLFECPDDDDARFMLATLHYLRGDVRTARRSLGVEPVDGWARASTRRLQGLVGRPSHRATAHHLTMPASPSVQRPVEPAVEASPAAPPPPASSAADRGTEEAVAADPVPDAAPSRPVDYERLQRDLAGAAAALDRFSLKLIEKMKEHQGGIAPPATDDGD